MTKSQKTEISVKPLRLATTNSHIVDNAAAEAPEFQMFREWVQNALEAEATKVYLHPEWVWFRETGVARLAISDNGVGMTKDELERLMGGLGESGKQVGQSHNFGVGAKLMSLPFNKRGIDVLSFVNGEPHLLRLCAGEDGNYGVNVFVGVDPFFPHDEHAVLNRERIHLCPEIPAGLVEEYQREHGTVVIFHGNQEGEDTFLLKKKNISGPATELPHRALRYLQRRYYRFNPKDGASPVVQMYFPPSKDKSEWATHEGESRDRGATKSQARTVHGCKYHQDKYCSDKGSFRIMGANVHWWTFGDATKFAKGVKDTEVIKAHASEKTGSSNGAGHGFVGFLYQDEVYEWTREPTRAAMCGLYSTKVRRRVTLLIEPDSELVHSNNVRSRLLSSSSEGLGNSTAKSR